jgi:hypothetical protein
MGQAASDRVNADGASALSLMEEALGLLDRCDAAPEIGAHLDLAICRLRENLEVAAPERDEHSGRPQDEVGSKATDSSAENS